MANPLRNAMVYFGLAEEEDSTYEQQTAPAPRATTPQPAQEDYVERAKPAPVTPITKQPTPVKQPVVGEMNEILTVHPKAYNKDAQVIAENFRNGIPVIMNLSQMEDAEARRLIDFASGLSQGLYGKIERVTNRVFLLSPEHVSVHGDERSTESEKDPSFFA